MRVYQQAQNRCTEDDSNMIVVLQSDLEMLLYRMSSNIEEMFTQL